MDFCICLQIGCSKRHSAEGETVHVCPRCHNGSVTAVKETKCLEICCVPLLPLGSSHVWQCGICQWQASQDGPAPPLAQQGGYGQQQQQWQQPNYGPQPGMQQQPYAPGGYGGQH